MKISKKIPVTILVTSMFLGILLPAVAGASPRSISIAIPNPEHGIVGTSVTVAGTTNPPGMLVDVCYTKIASGAVPDTPCSSSTLLAQAPSDATTGAWSATFNIPESVGGTHPVLAVFDTDSAIKATRQFTVDPLIAVSPRSGAVDDPVQVSGTGFATNSQVTINYDIPALQNCISLPLSTTPVNTNAVGSFTAQCNVPESDFTVSNGRHQITASTGRFTNSTFFTLIPSVSISPDHGPVGVDVNTDTGKTLTQRDLAVTVTARARGFIKLALVTVCFDRTGDFGNCQTGMSSPAGSLTLQFPMAQIPAGQYIFDANQTVGISSTSSVSLAGIRTATFTVVSDLDLLPDHAVSSGSPIQVQATGTGFAAQSPVTVVLRQLPRPNPGGPCTGTTVLTLGGGPNVVTRATGSFFLNFSAPSVSPGLYQVDARDGQGNEACADFAIGLFLRFRTGTPNEGKVGDTVTVQGYSFKPNSTISLQMLSTGGSPARSCDTISTKFTTDSNGDFGTTASNGSPAQFTVPQCNRGDYNVKATDSSGQAGVATPYRVFPWIDITPRIGNPGTTVAVTGTGFDSQVSVNVIYFGADAANDQLATTLPVGFNSQNSRTVWNGTIPQNSSGPLTPQDLTNVWQIETVGGEKIVATVTSGNFGNFATPTTFTIPESWGGFHPVYAREVLPAEQPPVLCGPDGNGQVLSSSSVLCGQPLRVQPTVSITPSDPKAGESLTLTGSGHMWWEHYTFQQFPRTSPQTINNVFRLSFDFGRTTGYIDEARHILNGQRDTSWELGSSTQSNPSERLGYLPIALNQKGTIVNWDFQLEDHTGSIPLGGSLGGKGSPFVTAPSLQPGDATIKAYRMQLGSLPTADRSEQATTGITVTSAENNSIDGAVKTINDNTNKKVDGAVSTLSGKIDAAVSSLSDKLDAAVTHIDSSIANAVTTLSGKIDAAVTSINSNTNTQVGNAVSTLGGKIDAAVTTLGGKIDTAVSSVNAYTKSQVDASVKAVNDYTKAQVDSAVSAIQSHITSQVSTATSSINTTTSSGVASLQDKVSTLPQTPVSYIIAVLAAIAALGAVATTVLVSRRLKVAG